MLSRSHWSAGPTTTGSGLNRLDLKLGPERGVLDMWLLQNTDSKPHAESRTPPVRVGLRPLEVSEPALTWKNLHCQYLRNEDR